jgi:hypothetical protein
MYRKELLANWERARRHEPLKPIDPLRQDVSMVRVRTVRCLHDFVVELTFTDGTTRSVDLEPFLTGPVFEPLRADPDLFRRIRVESELGTIVWPNGADICPDTLYLDLAPVDSSVS